MLDLVQEDEVHGAVEEAIAPDDDLLGTRSYVVKGLEDEIREAVAQCAAKRPNWVV